MMDLQKIEEEHYQLREGELLQDFVTLMLQYIGDPRPELRDGLIYSTFYEGIYEKNRFTKEELRSILAVQSSDGLEIEGVLSTPIEFDANKKYPLLVVIHGGPAWASFPIFSDCFNEKYPIEQFIEKDFIVLEPNYRGSSGYGNEFLKANYRKLGIANYDDVISGVDKLVGVPIM